MNSFWRYFSILDKLNTVFLFIIFVFYLFSLPSSPYTFEPLLVFFPAGLSIFLSVYFRKKKINTGLIKYFRLFYPLIFLFVIFESFFMILPFLNTHRYDSILAEIDRNLTGVNPTVWIERFNLPWITDLMYLLYLFYFPMPLFILVWLYKKKKMEALDQSVFIYMITYYGAYLLYFLIPAAGPRFYEPLIQLQQKDLNGIILSIPIRHLINFLEPNKLDAFPSLHAAISFTTLLTMARYNKRMFYFFLPVVTGIFISLIYCRYHYLIDVLAGVIWSAAAFMAGKKYYGKFVAGKTPLLYDQ
jgi:membrane-associated phospholipid phosphatase